MLPKGSKSIQRAIAFILLFLSFITFSVTASHSQILINNSSINSSILKSYSQNKIGKTNGKFKVVYTPVQGTNYKDLQQIFKQSKDFEELTNGLNKTFRLPVDITVNLQECGISNTFYEPQTQEITICYELIDYFATEFGQQTKSEASFGSYLVGATFFTFFHQAGHALIDILKLPVTQEENIAEQIATFLLTKVGDEGEEAALSGLHWFTLAASQPELNAKIAFFDQHLTELESFYNIVCLLYGSNPEKFADLVKQVELPPQRVKSCPAEYQKTSQTLLPLLAS